MSHRRMNDSFPEEAYDMLTEFSQYKACCYPGDTWWRHQMEAFSALLAICAGNSSVTGELPAQRSLTRSFDVFFDLRLNKRLSKQSWGWWFETLSRPLWRHCNDQGRSHSIPHMVLSWICVVWETEKHNITCTVSQITGKSTVKFTSLFRLTPRKTHTLCITSLCERKSLMPGVLHSQRPVRLRAVPCHDVLIIS